jgi:Ni2+-binding GTPase involved in maturation of urease and hydrogenase
MNGITKLIINKMDVLRQVDSSWNYYKNNILTSCENEDTFVSNIVKEVGNVLPGTLIQFQGQLH